MSKPEPIKRYAPAVSGEEPCIDEFVGMGECADGNYVTYADHAAEVDGLRAELEKAREQARLANIDWSNTLSELTATEAERDRLRTMVESRAQVVNDLMAERNRWQDQAVALEAERDRWMEQAAGKSHYARTVEIERDRLRGVLVGLATACHKELNEDDNVQRGWVSRGPGSKFRDALKAADTLAAALETP